MGKINLQMYSFLEDGKYESRESLKLASQLGFDGVEFFGADIETSAEEMKKYLKELGLEPISMHVGKDRVEEMIPYAKTLGMKFIGIPMELMMDNASVHAFAVELNELGEKCAAEGILLTYHNHTQEFNPCGDKLIIEVLLEETNPAYVGMELDAGWCAAAGYDPVEFVIKYSGRVKLIHVKESSKAIGPQPFIDYSSLPKDENGMPVFTREMKDSFVKTSSINCMAGEGLVDWKKLKKVADAHGCAAYIVERECNPEGGGRYDILKKDLAFYRTVI